MIVISRCPGKENYRLNEHGALTELCADSLWLSVESDTLYVMTDRGGYELSTLPCVREKEGFRYQAEDACFTLTYEPVPGSCFLKRTLSMTFRKKTILLRIGMRFPMQGSRLLYKTFYNASAAVFQRDGKLGL